MARQARLLTAKEVNALTKTTAVGGVPGLCLRIRDHGDRTYTLIKKSNGKTRQWTIGKSANISLADARKKATELLQQIEEGIDPVKKTNPLFSQPHKITVEQLLRMFIAAETERGRWTTKGRQTHAEKADGWIRNHMSAKFKATDITALTPQLVANEFGEKWQTMRTTPEKCIGELKRAIDWGIALNHIPSMINPADITGALGHLLPAASARPKRTHMPYLPPELIPDFIALLAQKQGCAARALIFAVLTTSRISNCLHLHWNQVDTSTKTITIPREEMKIKGLSFDRITPLSDHAISILSGMPRFPKTAGKPDWVFRDFVRGRAPISETSLHNLIRRINSDTPDHPFFDPNEFDAAGRHRLPTPHGLARASFETWAKNPSQFGHEEFDPDFIDACLDHFCPKYGGAYMRAYPLEDMRKILDAWAEYCFSKVS